MGHLLLVAGSPSVPDLPLVAEVSMAGMALAKGSRPILVLDQDPVTKTAAINLEFSRSTMAGCAMMGA